jgi:hypothetical protein
MQRLNKSIHLFISLYVFSCLFAGQFTSEEISRRSEIEELLKSADIIKSKEIGEGVTNPYKLSLEKDGKECAGCWKNPRGMQKGHLEGWQYEIAAYEMDKLVGLNMIPPTVEREFKGNRGSLQYWIASEMNDLERMEKGMDIPREKLLNWSRSKYLARAFDSLIGNDDRTQQNILYTKDWRMILIDHSRSFRSTEEYQERLVYGKNGLNGAKLFRTLPRRFVEKVESLTYDSVKAAVGDYLTEREIEAVMKRKVLLLQEIEEMIQEQGEDKILY